MFLTLQTPQFKQRRPAHPFLMRFVHASKPDHGQDRLPGAALLAAAAATALAAAAAYQDLLRREVACGVRLLCQITSNTCAFVFYQQALAKSRRTKAFRRARDQTHCTNTMCTNSHRAQLNDDYAHRYAPPPLHTHHIIHSSSPTQTRKPHLETAAARSAAAAARAAAAASSSSAAAVARQLPLQPRSYDIAAERLHHLIQQHHRGGQPAAQGGGLGWGWGGVAAGEEEWAEAMEVRGIRHW